MNLAQTQSPARTATPSLSICGDCFTGQPTMDTSPGSFDDGEAIRAAAATAIRNCSKKREVIAEQMTYLLGCKVTKRALDAYTADSAEQHRFPLQYLRAFCQVTGDWTVLSCVVAGSQFTLSTPEDRKLLELGRSYLRQKRAASAIAALELDLAEVAL